MEIMVASSHNCMCEARIWHEGSWQETRQLTCEHQQTRIEGRLRRSRALPRYTDDNPVA
jgi:hypothetical protein